MKLFLCSSFDEVIPLYKSFDKDLYKGKRVAFIPTAVNVEDYKENVIVAKKCLKELGMIVYNIDIATADYSLVEDTIKLCDSIYIAGGNTFYLLQELIRTKTDKLIIDAIIAGKLYIGESAGSMIVSNNIDYVRAMDDPSLAPLLTTFDALSLVDFYVVPHYNDEPFKDIAHKMYDDNSSNLNMIAIGNSEAITVVDSKVSVMK
ncbi:MAG: Type 1 glutamine amidotransferase-like domain-containing protein [Erysipelotrichaceae bacterium]